MAMTAKNQMTLSSEMTQIPPLPPTALINERPVMARTVAMTEKRNTIRSHSQADCSMCLMRRYSSAFSRWARSPSSVSGVIDRACLPSHQLNGQ